jgi:site-specific recombinase XerD
MACCQSILDIPAKKQARPDIPHLTLDQTRRLLGQPDRSTRRGRRDATLLATLYDTAARVQELADLTVRDIRLDRPAMAALTGKGRKTRHVPLLDNTAALLGAYLAERAKMARLSSRQGNLAMRIRDELGEVYADARFIAVFGSGSAGDLAGPADDGQCPAVF